MGFKEKEMYKDMVIGMTEYFKEIKRRKKKLEKEWKKVRENIKKLDNLRARKREWKMEVKKGRKKVAMLDSRLSKKEGTRIETERMEEKGNWLGLRKG